jgi:ParB/RepB/Spo0J family partition protein
VVPLSAKREVRAEANRALHAMKVAWLSVGLLRESREVVNSRKAYDEAGINELAASIQEHGLLQPILVVPEDEEYRVVCGERRRRASIRAGLEEVPCVVKQQADQQTIFLWNIVENIQRVDLSPREKVAAIQQLGKSGLGIREISRGTGISPGTISRWLRIADKPTVVRALEEGRIDIARAMRLAPVHDDEQVEWLIEAAPTLPQADFFAMARQAAQRVVLDNTYCVDDGRLADIDRKLALVQVITPVGRVHLLRIREMIDSLLQQTVSEDSANGRPGVEQHSSRRRKRRAPTAAATG